jgi:hypothetical protein
MHLLSSGCSRKSNKPDKKASPVGALTATAAIATPNRTNYPDNPKPVAGSTLQPRRRCWRTRRPDRRRRHRPSSRLHLRRHHDYHRRILGLRNVRLRHRRQRRGGGVQAGSCVAVMQGIGATGTLSTGLTLGAAAAGGRSPAGGGGGPGNFLVYGLSPAQSWAWQA